MIKISIRSIILLLIAASASFFSYAHQIRMSVYPEGANVEGEIYFVGGGNPPGSGAFVELKQGDNVIATTIADDEGLFIFESVTPDSYTVRADGGQGHVAFYELEKPEFPDVEVPSEEPVANATQAANANSDAKCSSLTQQELQQAISKAIRPLREKIDRYEAKTRMHDVVGGIGYIFGLFGLFMFVRNRKK